MLSSSAFLNFLVQIGAASTNGHFVNPETGKHKASNFNEGVFYKTPTAIKVFTRALAEEFASTDDNVHVVIAPPTVNGLIISNWMAEYFTKSIRNVLSAHSEHGHGDVIVVQRGQEKLVSGRNVLVVTDVLENNIVMNKLIDAVRISGGMVVGVGAIWNQCKLNTADLMNVPKLISLIDLKVEEWGAPCPLCAQKIPINNPQTE